MSALVDSVLSFIDSVALPNEDWRIDVEHDKAEGFVVLMAVSEFGKGQCLTFACMEEIVYSYPGKEADFWSYALEKLYDNIRDDNLNRLREKYDIFIGPEIARELHAMRSTARYQELLTPLDGVEPILAFGDGVGDQEMMEAYNFNLANGGSLADFIWIVDKGKQLTISLVYKPFELIVLHLDDVVDKRSWEVLEPEYTSLKVHY